MKNFTCQLGEKAITFELNNWAEQANANVLVKAGDTSTFVTAVMAKNEASNLGFFPLTVDYEEKFYAAGKILGSRFVRRESKPSHQTKNTSPPPHHPKKKNCFFFFCLPTNARGIVFYY